MKLPFSKLSRALPLFQRGHRLHCVYLSFLEREEGVVYVDDAKKPCAALYLHPFMAVLAGDANCGEELVKMIPLSKIILPLDSGWDPVIKSVLGEKAIPVTRTKFAEEPPGLKKAKAMSRKIAKGYTVEAIGSDNIDKLLETFSDAKGIIGLFWNRETFLAESFGYIALDSERNIVSVGIMGTPLYNGAFEIHTETHPDHRRKGLATAVNAAVIVEAAARGTVPLWDAANQMSADLAKKLGFREIGEYDIFYYSPGTTG